jgi:hypothetical protein
MKQTPFEPLAASDLLAADNPRRQHHGFEHAAASMLATDQYLRSRSDDEIQRLWDVAKRDLTAASRTTPNSEWHEACFAGVIVIGQEAVRRGLCRPKGKAANVSDQ